MKNLTLIFFVFISSFLNSQTINENTVKKHLYTLANDSMQGRKAGSPGIEKAAKYIEQQFSEIGLKPFNSSSFSDCFFEHFSVVFHFPQNLSLGSTIINES